MCYSTTFTYPQKVGIISLINNINVRGCVKSPLSLVSNAGTGAFNVLSLKTNTEWPKQAIAVRFADAVAGTLIC